MCFDVLKVVRSPRCDHGHDEESRNGRAIKIDILEGYIRTSERFRVIRVFFGVPESYGNSPGSIWALLGFRGKREERLGAPTPQGLVRIGLGGGAAPPPSFSSLFPFPDSYSYYLEGGNPTPGGSRTPPGRAIGASPLPPPPLLYIRGQGAPHRHTS